jgi:hypothetical protein
MGYSVQGEASLFDRAKAEAKALTIENVVGPMVASAKSALPWVVIGLIGFWGAWRAVKR